jgi:hypothetical protein
MSRSSRVRWVTLLPVTLLVAACSSPTGAPTSGAAPASAPATSSAATPTAQPSQVATTGAQAAIVPEQNPPGDIPDNQVYVAYKPAGAKFEVKVPEGWSRTPGASTASFTDKLNAIGLTWTTAATAPTTATVSTTDVAALQNTAAFQLVGVTQAKTAAGPAILLRYRQNGEPSAVTGKRYRLDVERFIFFHSGERVDLTLSSPVGADNVDPWRIVSESLRWL